MQTHNAQADPRAELINKLVTLRDLTVRIPILERKADANAASRRPLLLEPDTWRHWAFLAWTVLFTVLAFTAATPVTNTVFQVVLSPFMTKGWMEAHVPIAIAIMLATPVAAAAALALLVTVLRNLLILPWHRALIIRANVKRKVHNDMAAHDLRPINKELGRANAVIRESRTWYPKAYLNEDALNFCALAIQNHRASDIPTAINLYEAELQHRSLMAAQERTQAAIMMQGFLDDMNARSTQNAIREEGARTRASNSADAARVADQLRKPQTIHLRRR